MPRTVSWAAAGPPPVCPNPAAARHLPFRRARRRPAAQDPPRGAEYVDVFGVPFSLIPFKGRPPGGGPPPEDRPKHEVMALPERKAFEIRFPIVEGYVVSLRKNRIVCDLDAVERTSLDPWTTPTAAFVRPQVGYQIGHPGDYAGFEFGFEEVDRRQYYESVHPQTIEFAIAAEIVRSLTDAAHPGKERLRRESRRTLFPRVLCIVQDYIRERVDLNGLHPCDVGLQTYARRIVDLLVAAILPDDSEGEAPLLPRLNRYRPIGSTGSVHFKTVKPVQATIASHLNHVACDTGSRALRRPARLGARLHRAAGNGLGVVLEVKGRTHGDTDVKHQAARRWVAAVNQWGKLGKWAFLVCRDPQSLDGALAGLSEAEARSAHNGHAAVRGR